MSALEWALLALVVVLVLVGLWSALANRAAVRALVRTLEYATATTDQRELQRRQAVERQQLQGKGPRA